MSEIASGDENTIVGFAELSGFSLSYTSFPPRSSSLRFPLPIISAQPFTSALVTSPYEQTGNAVLRWDGDV